MSSMKSITPLAWTVLCNHTACSCGGCFLINCREFLECVSPFPLPLPFLLSVCFEPATALRPILSKAYASLLDFDGLAILWF